MKYGFIITRYESEKFPGITIERRLQRDNSVKWAVCRGGSCLASDGLWEYEMMPANRDDGFLSRCRFDSLEEAMQRVDQLPNET